MRVSHILYSGLGGHGSVFFSLVAAQTGTDTFHEPIFFGVEPVRPEYTALCEHWELQYRAIIKAPGSHFRAQMQLFNALKQSRPQVIMAHSGASLPAAWLYKLIFGKVALLLVEHQANHLKSRLEWLASFLAPWLCDKVVYLTEASRLEVRRRLGRLCRVERSEVIPNGIDLERFIPIPSERTDGKFRIGMIARMNPLKDHENLIRSLTHLQGSDLPSPLLLLAGDGPCRRRLELLAVELGVSEQVEFLGMLDEAQLADMLQNLDVYAHSTLGETMSTAIMQAQACGLPVVASDVSGVSDQIEHGVDGILVPPQNPERLAEAVSSLSKDPSLSGRLSLAGRAKAEAAYSHQQMRENYDRVLLSLKRSDE